MTGAKRSSPSVAVMALSNAGLARSVVIAGKAAGSRLLATVPTATAVAEGSSAEGDKVEGVSCN